MKKEFGIDNFLLYGKEKELAIAGAYAFKLDEYHMTEEDIKKALEYIETAIVSLDPEDHQDRIVRHDAMRGLYDIKYLFK